MNQNTSLRLHLLRQGEWSAGELATADKALRDLKEVLPNILVDCPILTRLNMELCEIHIRQQHKKIKEMETRLEKNGWTYAQKDKYFMEFIDLIEQEASVRGGDVSCFIPDKELHALFDKHAKKEGKS